MSSVIALLLLIFALCGARPVAAQGRGIEELPLTIRIHDYTQAPGGVISNASRIASDVYARIGVRTEWLGVWRPQQRNARPARGSDTSQGQTAQITINLLTPQMAARAHFRDDALSVSAAATERMGRVGYVMYERLRDTAQRASINVDDLLAFVMAQTIARLLLPSDSALDGGPTKSRFTIDEIRRLDVRTFGFSTLAADLMRSTIENDVAPALAARAARAGSRQSTTAEPAAGVNQPDGR
jgi:hypothetical protein